jgi:protein gp37
MTKLGPVWNGKVNVVPEAMDKPLRWRKPRRIFVCSMSDLFYEGVPRRALGQIFGTMAEASWHTFLVLTKRPQRLLDYSVGLVHYPDGNRSRCPVSGWPPNVHVGVSAETQEVYDEREPVMEGFPSSKRWLSLEPLLSPVDLTLGVEWSEPGTGADWVVVGGESGPGARPCQIRWIEKIVRQCEGVAPVFVKQLGSVLARELNLKHPAGAEPNEWPEELRVQEIP